MNDIAAGRRVVIVSGAAGALIMLSGILAPLLSHTMTSISVHHLLHAGMAAGAGMLALALAAGLKKRDRERDWWMIPAVLAPAVGLLLMWPSEYAYLMSHPWLHVCDHLGIALAGFLAVFSAQAYVRGLGWPMLILMVAMDAAAAGGFGVSPGLVSLAPPRPQARSSPSGMGKKVQPLSLRARGAHLYLTLGCSGCHSVNGAKSIGPTWRNLAGYPQTLADSKTRIANDKFLKNAILFPDQLHLKGFPRGVMPDTYRAMLAGARHPRELRLRAIIAYIHSLSNRGNLSRRPSPNVLEK